MKRLAPTAVACALLLAGCADDGDPPAGDAAAATSPQSNGGEPIDQEAGWAQAGPVTHVPEEFTEPERFGFDDVDTRDPETYWEDPMVTVGSLLGDNRTEAAAVAADGTLTTDDRNLYVAGGLPVLTDQGAQAGSSATSDDAPEIHLPTASGVVSFGRDEVIEFVAEQHGSEATQLGATVDPDSEIGSIWALTSEGVLTVTVDVAAEELLGVGAGIPLANLDDGVLVTDYETEGTLEVIDADGETRSSLRVEYNDTTIYGGDERYYVAGNVLFTNVHRDREGIFVAIDLADGTVHELAPELEAIFEDVAAIDVSPDGQRIALLSADLPEEVYVPDHREYEWQVEVINRDGFGSVFSLRGNEGIAPYAALGFDGERLLLGIEGLIEAIDVTTSDRLWTYQPVDDWVLSSAFSTDRGLLLLKERRFNSQRIEGVIDDGRPIEEQEEDREPEPEPEPEPALRALIVGH